MGGGGGVAWAGRKRPRRWTAERMPGKFIAEWNKSRSIPTLLSKGESKKKNSK